MTFKHCEHVYRNVKSNPCELCGKETHAIDWEYQNLLHKEWKKANPDAKYQGWWSI